MERKNIDKGSAIWARSRATEANPLRGVDLSRLGVLSRIEIRGANRQGQLHLKLLLAIEIHTLTTTTNTSATPLRSRTISCRRFNRSDSPHCTRAGGRSWRWRSRGIRSQNRGRNGSGLSQSMGVIETRRCGASSVDASFSTSIINEIYRFFFHCLNLRPPLLERSWEVWVVTAGRSGSWIPVC